MAQSTLDGGVAWRQAASVSVTCAAAAACAGGVILPPPDTRVDWKQGAGGVADGGGRGVGAQNVTVECFTVTAGLRGFDEAAAFCAGVCSICVCNVCV